MIQAWANGQWQSYVYDGDGRRIKRIVNGTETWQVYGLGGELLAEYAANAAASNPQKEYGYRNGELLVTADVTVGLPPPVFSDDFNTASLDTAKWTATDPSRVTDNGQQLQITLLPNTAGYYAAYSNSTYDFTGKTATVEVAQPISQAGWCENFIQVALDGNNYFLIDAGAGSMTFRSMVNGVNDQNYLATYDPAIEHYWRIRHDQAANTINFETSADNSTWTLRKTAVVGFSLTSMRVYLYAGAWGTGNGAPGAAKYDNFKLQANTQTTIASLHWLVTDQLGTPRMVFDQTGSLANVSRHDYLPFGEEVPANFRSGIPGYATADGVRQKFTGYEADAETGLNFAQARYQSPVQGRFTSVDPLGASASIANPQSFNRYSYVINNPTNFVDPTGMMLKDIGVYQTYDPEEADTLQRKSDADWKRAINAGYARDHGGTVTYDKEGRASFTSNRTHTWALNMARDTAANLTNSMFGGFTAGQEPPSSPHDDDDVLKIDSEPAFLPTVYIWNGRWKFLFNGHWRSTYGHVSYSYGPVMRSWEGGGWRRPLPPVEQFIEENNYRTADVYVFDFGPRKNRLWWEHIESAYDGIAVGAGVGSSKGSGYDLFQNNCAAAFCRSASALGFPTVMEMSPSYLKGYIDFNMKQYVKRHYTIP